MEEGSNYSTHYRGEGSEGPEGRGKREATALHTTGEEKYEMEDGRWKMEATTLHTTGEREAFWL